jgi:hypothetical protein
MERVIPDQLPKLPSDLVLEKLRNDVMADAGLPDAIKEAFLVDLRAVNPSALIQLKAALAGKGSEA